MIGISRKRLHAARAKALAEVLPDDGRADLLQVRPAELHGVSAAPKAHLGSYHLILYLYLI